MVPRREKRAFPQSMRCHYLQISLYGIFIVGTFSPNDDNRAVQQNHGIKYISSLIILWKNKLQYRSPNDDKCLGTLCFFISEIILRLALTSLPLQSE